MPRLCGWVASLLIALVITLHVYNVEHHPGIGSPIYPGDGPLPRGGGRYVVGQPYEVAGRWYSPAEQPNYHELGIASWYGPQFDRHETANGEWFDMDYITAAHTTLPLPSYVRVTNLENGRTLVVRVNDRGPFVNDRIIDLSRKSAELLNMVEQGTANVSIDYLGPAPLNDDGTDLAVMNRRSKTAAKSPKRATQKGMVADVSLIAGSTAPTPEPTRYIQVACFPDLKNAELARDRLSSIGHTELFAFFRGSSTFYRVRLGPLSDAEQARQAIQQVIDAGYADAQFMAKTNSL